MELSRDMRDTFERCCGDLLEPSEEHRDPEKAGAHLAPRPAGEGEQSGGRAEAAAGAWEAQRREQEEAAAAALAEDPLPGFVSSAGEGSGGEGHGGAGSDGEGGGPGGEAAEADEAELKAEAEFVSRWAAELPGGGWLRANPVGVPTEREVATLANGGGVFRMLLIKK